LRHVRASRPHPAELDSTSPAAPLPPGTVMLVCGETGDPLSDVIERAEGWWPDWRRYAFNVNPQGVCTADPPHLHEDPTQEEIAARVAEAKQTRRVIQHRVKVKR
jgi:hypothetical protein